jgi:hypothetical protein
LSEGHQYVDVAVRSRLASRGRTEQAEFSDLPAPAELAQLVPVGFNPYGCHSAPNLAPALSFAPEAAAGGPIATLRDGDTIVFDLDKRRLDVELDESEMRSRPTQWRAPSPRYKTGVFAKYARLV